MERIISMFPWEIMENIYCNNRVNVSLSAWVIVINSSRISFFFFLIFFYFKILYWFFHTSTWIRHRCTCVPHSEPPSHLPPIPSFWVIPVHQPRASCIMHQTWTGELFHIWYTCFNAILPNHPTLALSHRVQKTVLYICVSFAVSFTGLLLPSF